VTAMPDPLAVDVDQVPFNELPALLGRLVELEARVRIRLAREAVLPRPGAPRVIDPDEAALIAGTSRRWLLHRTRGMAFRCDLSRKSPRFEEAGLRAWLLRRRYV
jgi:hypothetical protein